MKNNHKLNKKGVTLVEVMIALTVLLIAFLGMIQASLLAIEHNTRTEIRDEAVRVATQSLARLKAVDFGNSLLNSTGGAFPTTENTSLSTTRNFRNFSITYNVFVSVLDLDAAPSNKQVGIKVRYTLPQGGTFDYDIFTTLRRS